MSKNTDLKNRKVVWPGHFLAPLHHLPVGDLGARLFQLWQLDRDVELGDRFQVKALAPEEVQGVLGVGACLDDTHLHALLRPSVRQSNHGSSFNKKNNLAGSVSGRFWPFLSLIFDCKKMMTKER